MLGTSSLQSYLSSPYHSINITYRLFKFYHRGGGELGNSWYNQGKALNKLNSFNDFIDCTEYLASNRYCHPQRIAAHVTSAGGLLLGKLIDLPSFYLSRCSYLSVSNAYRLYISYMIFPRRGNELETTFVPSMFDERSLPRFG